MSVIGDTERGLRAFSPGAAPAAPGLSILPQAQRLRAGTSKIYVDGRWREPSSDTIWQHISPASNEPDFTIACAVQADVEEAVRAARRAFDDGPWARMHARERRLKLRPLGDLIRSHADMLHELQSIDNVLPIAVGSSFRFSAHFAAEVFEYFQGWIDKIGGDAPPVFSEHAAAQIFTLKEPVGVVAAITPFNAPVMQFAQKVGPALAAGCTMVLKPSEYASNVSALFAKLIQELDLPPGVFNMITGSADTSAAMVRHPLIDKIAFTGRHVVGREILAQAAPGLKRVQLELGGKSPSIVFDDVEDVDAVGRYCMSVVSMGLSGQVCSTQTRALVHQSIYDRFVSAAERQISEVRLGHPFDPEVTSSPLVTRAAADRAIELIQSATEAGARLVAGGSLVGGTGNWVQPTLLADVDNNSPAAQEEIFGPVLCVVPFADEAEAIRLANETQFGLSAGVYTANPSRAIRVARRIRAGSVGINGLFVSPPPSPFGGYKVSGLGREGGREGLEGYLETKAISIPLGD